MQYLKLASWVTLPTSFLTHLHWLSLSSADGHSILEGPPCHDHYLTHLQAGCAGPQPEPRPNLQSKNPSVHAKTKSISSFWFSSIIEVILCVLACIEIPIQTYACQYISSVLACFVVCIVVCIGFMYWKHTGMHSILTGMYSIHTTCIGMYLVLIVCIQYQYEPIQTQYIPQYIPQ